MATNDPIADMLTRIRNAVAIKRKTVKCLNSKVCQGIAEVLKAEGYVNDYDVIDDGRQGFIRVHLKYGPHGERVLRRLTRESKPGCRVYTKVKDMPRPLEGLGIAIVSTPKGVLSDRKCRELSVGGELLATIE
ncbi:MAG TPA: 30S ribosomal protein S8 [Phycisphaeraceae bacterium]|nr:30S ribosomal protein S8 [Phycisphaeraceae bacterium]